MKIGRVACLTGGIGIGAVVAGAAIPIAMAQDEGDVFYACARSGNVIAGTMRVDSEPTCGGGATVVSWSESGPQGPPGPPGPAGASGGTAATSGDGWGHLFAEHEVRLDFSSCPPDEVRFVVTLAAGEPFLPVGPTECAPIRSNGSFSEYADVFLDPLAGTPDVDELYAVPSPMPLSGQPRSRQQVATPTRTLSAEIRCSIPPSYTNPPALFACSYDGRVGQLTATERQLLADADPVFTLRLNAYDDATG